MKLIIQDEVNHFSPRLLYPNGPFKWTDTFKSGFLLAFYQKRSGELMSNTNRNSRRDDKAKIDSGLEVILSTHFWFLNNYMQPGISSRKAPITQ